MTIQALLTELKYREIDLFIKDGELIVDAPKGAVTTELKEKIGAFKNDILNILNEGKTNPPAIKRAQYQSPIPLSEKQRGLWFINKFQEGAETQYNIPWSYKILGKLDCLALEKAFNTIIQRHETLRTKFCEINNEVVQVVEDELKLVVKPIQVAESEVAAKIDKHAIHVFNLTQGPLIKVDLLRLSHNEHILLINMHHIISDGWSLSILNNELNTLYGDYTKGMASSLAPLSLQYADFIDWERQQMLEDSISEGVGFWKEKLAGAPTLLELPTDRSRPSKQSFEGSSEKFIVPKALTKQLSMLADKENASLFSVLMAAFQILLHRLSGETDICVGVPFANRQQPDLEQLIGLFLNVVVFRNQIERSLSFRDFLPYIHETNLAAQDHQNVPFERLVEALHPERSLSHTPIFQVMLVLQTASDVSLDLKGLKVIPSQSHTHTSKFDLTMELAESPDGILGRIEYSTDLFDQLTIKRFCQHYQVLLDSIVDNPDQPIASLPLLSKPEKQKILVDWNSTQATYPRGPLIHSLFEQQVEQTPNRVAVAFEDQQFTYSELNQKSNQLAHYLLKQGVRPEVRVGLCLERSLEMIVAILGILKAGGAYVPIDSEYPKQRIEHILSDSGVSLLVTQEKLIHSALKEYCGPYVLLDEDRPDFSENLSDNPSIQVEPQNLAYVIYTSGSTGMPKGVMIDHAPFLNHMQWMLSTFEFNCEDKVLQKTPLGFDAAGWEWALPLIIGAQLILAKPGGHREPDYLLNLIASRNVTVLQVVPSLLNLLLEDPNRKNLRSLRYLFSGGEAMSANQCMQFKDQELQATLCNLYGPTEATIDSTFFPISAKAPGSAPPIGQPISNSQSYILDAQFEPVPIGVTGELYISGQGLARGYLNRFDLTAERFVPNPFGSTPGSRLYKTGDLARHLPNGNIEYVGRTDHQIKIRGFRIELGEIENTLVEQEEIHEAVVLAHGNEEQPANRYLAAYIISEQDLDIDQDRLRENLKASLPDYMVPSFFIELDKLPLTPNGKVDRKALPEPDLTSLKIQEYVPPQTEIEQVLVSVWAEILSLPPESIGVLHDFFELGGNSISLVRAISLSKKRGLEIILKEVFEKRTIRQIAASIIKAGPDEATPYTLEKEIQLDKSISVRCASRDLAKEQISQPKAIFLTGCTGFVGVFLLKELLEQTNAKIFCLIRANSDQQALSRITKKLQVHQLLNKAAMQRIEVVLGDLSKPLLGLDPDKFDALSGSVDSIVHNGAWVNHLYPYDTLKATNIGGTREVLKLATQARLKTVHYISVFDAEFIREQDFAKLASGPHEGYRLTKYASEKMVRAAADRDIPISIHRLGMISGDQQGISNVSDRVCLLIKGCIALKYIPDAEGIASICAPRLTPVDFAAKAIVSLSSIPASIGNIYNITNPMPMQWGELLAAIKEMGYKIEVISLEGWKTKLAEAAEFYPDEKIYETLSGLYLSDHQSRAITSYQEDPNKNIADKNLLDAAEETAIRCAAVDRERLKRYLGYLEDCGFLQTASKEFTY